MKAITHLRAVSGRAEILATVSLTLTAHVWGPSWASSCRRGSEEEMGARRKGWSLFLGCGPLSPQA